MPSIASSPALPANPKVIAGQATIVQTTATTLSITEQTGRAIVDWQSFSIGAGETVNFVQPGSTAVILNRVIGNDTSRIFGSLTANGIVYLINPGGILFGRNSEVDVGGLVASTLDVANTNFMARQARFIASTKPAAVDVRGSIYANKLVVIQGGAVNVSGLIQAGSAALNSDGRITLSGTSIAQNGTIYVPGGSIALSGTSVLLGSGTTSVRSATGDGGTITVEATSSITAAGSQLNASGLGAGGMITMTAPTISLSGASVSAEGNGASSSDQAGGIIRIGGDPHGQGPLANAGTVVVDAKTTIDASALARGTGGQITVWADNSDTVAGTLLARGGSLGGDGGSIETSGAYLNVAGITLDTSAQHGQIGSWLLDPVDITIGTGTAANLTESANTYQAASNTVSTSFLPVTTLETALATSNIRVNTNAGAGATATGQGNITVSAPVLWSASSVLTLNAANNITISAGLGSITHNGANTGGITLVAGNTITIGAFVGGAGTNAGPMVVSMTAQNIQINALVASLGGSISLTASRAVANGGGNLTIGPAGTVDSGTGGSILLVADTDVTIGGAISSTTNVAAEAGRSISLNGSLSGKIVTIQPADTGVQTADTQGGTPSFAISGASSITGSQSVTVTVSGDQMAVNGPLTILSPLTTLTVGSFQNSSTLADSGGSLIIASSGTFSNSGTLSSTGGDMTLTSGAAFTNGSTISDSGGTLSITGPTITNSGAVSNTTGNIAMTASDVLSSSASISATRGLLTLKSGGNAIVGGGTLTSSGAMTVWSGDAAIADGATGANPILSIGNTTQLISTGGDITLIADAGVSGGTGSFLNAATQAFSAATRWRVFSTNPNPSSDTIGILASQIYAKRYNCAYMAGAPVCYTVNETIPTGNALFYTDAPILTVTPGNVSEIYGNAISFSAISSPSLSGFIDGDGAGTAGLTGGNYTTDATSTSNVGIYGISYTGGLTSALGYKIQSGGALGQYRLSARELTLSSVTVADKVFDGTTSATVSVYGSLSNLVNGDLVTAGNGVAAFASDGPGNNILVDVQNIKLLGAGAANYVLSPDNVMTTANITSAQQTTSNQGSTTVTEGTSAAALKTSFTSVINSTVLSTASSSGDTATDASLDSSKTSKSAVTGDLTVDSGNTGNNASLVSPSADPDFVTVSIPQLGRSTLSNQGYNCTSCILVAMGFLVKKDNWDLTKILDETIRINDLTSQHGLGINLIRDLAAE